MMKQYKDLTEQQKKIFQKVEDIFISHPSVTVHDYVTVLGVVINKYKRC